MLFAGNAHSGLRRGVVGKIVVLAIGRFRNPSRATRCKAKSVETLEQKHSLAFWANQNASETASNFP